MLKPIAFLVILAASLSVSPCWAGAVDDSGDASGAIGAGALSAIAAPALVSAGVAGLAAATGVGLSELTSDTWCTPCATPVPPTQTTLYITQYTPASPTVQVTVNHQVKTIPFVVRKDYIQMNQPLTP